MQAKTTVGTFATFHYDVAYMKTFEGYLDETMKIFDAGLALLAKHPQFIFLVEQVIVAREYLARNPAAKTSMRRFAAEGRLLFAPGMFTMPDSNIPSGESFIRNFLIGRDWLVENLDLEPKICWMADIFGHNPQSPQLANLCGYIGYMFERGKNRGDDTLFWWEGIDGSRILTQWEIDTYYGIGIPLTPYVAERDPDWVAAYMEKTVFDPLRDNSAVKHLIISPIGGDFRRHEPKDLEFIAAYNRLNRPYRIVFASPEKYFEEVRQKYADRVPVLKADFNPLEQGAYSSRIRIKQANRRLENSATALEMLEAVAQRRAAGAKACAAKLWETIAWNAFHDIICGSLVNAALRETFQDYAAAERAANAALASLLVDGTPRRQPAWKRALDHVVTLFNSLPYARDEIVEIPLKTCGWDFKSAELFSVGNAKFTTQIVASADEYSAKALDLEGKEIKPGKVTVSRRAAPDTISILAKTALPAASIRSFGIALKRNAAPTRPAGSTLMVRDNLLENRFLKAVFGRNGTIISLIDKEHGTELADPGRSALIQTGLNNILRQPDYGDPWNLYRAPTNGALLYTHEMRDPVPLCGLELQRRGGIRVGQGFGGADADATWAPQIEIIEKGPLRAALEITYPELKTTTRVYLAENEKLLRFQTRFMPEGRHYRLRVAFPSSIRHGKIRCSVPCGFAERPEGEYPAQDWIDYADGEKGLCLLNRGLPGNNVTDDTLILSLFRGVSMEETGELPWYEEGIEQVFEYALRPFGPQDKDYNPARLGMLFNRPVYQAFPDLRAPTPMLNSLLEIEGAQAELMCYRKVGDELEVRLYESRGQGGAVKIRLPNRIAACRKTDVKGQSMQGTGISAGRNSVVAQLKPFEIVNLRIRIKS